MGTIPDVDQIKQQAAFASLRVPAWHNLGTVIQEPLPTDEFMKIAHLDNLNERKVSAAEIGANLPFAGEQFFVVGTNPFTNEETILAPVGGRYEVYTTNELAAFGEHLTDGAYRWETMGAMNEFRSVFMSLVHPDDIVIDPNGSADKIRRFLLLHTTHDGSGNVIAKDTPVRVVCKNTLDMAVSGKGSIFKIRHTPNMRDRAVEAKKVLGFAAAYDAEFEREMNELFAKDITTGKFWDIVVELNPKPENDVKGSLKKWENATGQIMEVWNGATGTMEDLPKNAYKALQTLTETAQWMRGIRAGNVESFLAAGAGFDNLALANRTKILKTVQAMV